MTEYHGWINIIILSRSYDTHSRDNHRRISTNRSIFTSWSIYDFIDAFLVLELISPFNIILSTFQLFFVFTFPFFTFPLFLISTFSPFQFFHFCTIPFFPLFHNFQFSTFLLFPFFTPFFHFSTFPTFHFLRDLCFPTFPLFHFSTFPLFHFSTFPLFHFSHFSTFLFFFSSFFYPSPFFDIFCYSSVDRLTFLFSWCNLYLWMCFSVHDMLNLFSWTKFQIFFWKKKTKMIFFEWDRLKKD